MKRLSFDQIISPATKSLPGSASGRDLTTFQYFNPNGIYAAKCASDDRITAAVEAGLCKSGAIIAYGSFNDFYTRQLRQLIDLRRISKSDLLRTVRGIEDEIASATKFLADIPANARPTVLVDTEHGVTPMIDGR